MIDEPDSAAEPDPTPQGSAPPGDAPAADEAAETPEVASTVFEFKNRIFHFSNCFFERHQNDGEPAFFLNYGDVRLSIAVARLSKDFGLNPQSADAQMLQLVASALNYVRRIHPGDSIPNELLDGTASWAVEAHHVKLGRGRVILAIANVPHDPEAIALDYIDQILGDPMTESRVEANLGDLLRQSENAALSVPILRDRLEAAGREGAYIEALFDAVAKIKWIRDTVLRVRGQYSREKLMLESIGRVIALFDRPLDDMARLRTTYIALTQQTRSLLVTEAGPVKPLREVRDRLRFEVLRWELVCARWTDLELLSRGPMDRAIRDLYVFLARHFRVEVPWNTGAAGQGRRLRPSRGPAPAPQA